MFTNSVVSYPNRGNFGNNRYRGNCTGHIIVDLIETYLPAGGLFVDPAIGGGTSLDVANSMGIRYFCTDLHQGFDLVKDDLAKTVGEQADLVFFHAPYANMVVYSGHMWGKRGEPHEGDLSRMNDEQFVAALQVCLFNISDSVKPGGHYGVLMGNQRRKGQYINWSSLVERLAPDPLVDEIIKIQHNCVSDSTQYQQKKLVRIAHEKLLVFKKRPESDVLTWLHHDHEALRISVTQGIERAIRRILQCASFTSEQLVGLILARAPHYSKSLILKVLKECPYIIYDNGYFRLK
ncbi:hypothetical protein TUM3794_19790 [Shewanella colwelliana]|uniref:DNA adenine modification methylase n=1 Tax=Shewanella colwelliana TaxID=23 RepID=A0ABQ4P081_SHECO|nr:DNA adenine modification methylase [Shewanella colwelliana]GIU40867.1 hypothetical protein TUM3794_19790 [Shewanella colwelliana]